MDRRTLLSAVAAFLGTASLAAEAQPASSRRIGFLGNGNPTTGSPQREAFVEVCASWAGSRARP